MTDNHARPPEKINRDFVKPARVSPAQRKRDFEADEAAEYKAHQVELRVAAYRRLFNQSPPDGNAA
jgi:hypothetical protein